MGGTETEAVYVALGSNMGDREAHLAWARGRLAALPDTRLVAVSRVEETAALGPVPQAPYLNQMALLETALAPEVLLHRLLELETAAGRRRTPGFRWEARPLDLDIVRFGQRALRGPELTLPHPGLEVRDFWRREMAELETAAQRGHPRPDRA